MKDFLGYGLFAVIAFCFWFYFHGEEIDCEKRGGVLARGLTWGYTCVKEIK